MRAPIPPPEPVQGVAGPSYLAHDGHVWRRGMGRWDTLDQTTAQRLLALYHKDSRNTSDWFHPRAAELAMELGVAIIEARETQQDQAA